MLFNTMAEWAKTTGSIWDVDMEKDGACKMDRKNKKCSCARKSGRMKNNAGNDKEEEKKLAGSLAKKKLPAEGCSRSNGKRKEGSWQKKISDNRQHYDKWTVCSYEKEGWEEGRVENAEFVVKDLPLSKTLWLINWLIDVLAFHCLPLHWFLFILYYMFRTFVYST